MDAASLRHPIQISLVVDLTKISLNYIWKMCSRMSAIVKKPRMSIFLLLSSSESLLDVLVVLSLLFSSSSIYPHITPYIDLLPIFKGVHGEF